MDSTALTLIDICGALQALVEETAALRKEIAETTRQLMRMVEVLEFMATDRT